MTITSPSLKRSVQIKITLTADLHARLRNLSAQLGQVPASIAAIAVAEYVRSREIQAGAIQSMGQQLMPMLERQFGEQMKLAEGMSLVEGITAGAPVTPSHGSPAKRITVTVKKKRR